MWALITGEHVLNTRLRHLVPVIALVGLVSCGGDMENAEEAFPSPGNDANLATSTMRERCDEVEATCLDAQGASETSEQAEPVAGQPLGPDYAEGSFHSGLFRVEFSIGDIFELDELEGEVVGRVWMPCLSFVMILEEPDRQDLRARNLTVDTINAVLGLDFESRTRELATLARGMSGPEREAFFEEQIMECVDVVVKGVMSRP